MQPDPILQPQIPPGQITAAAQRLPQMQPVRPGEWLCVDAAYGAQLAEKARLIAERRGDVIAVLPVAAEAAMELLEVVLAELAGRADFARSGDRVMRPDGQEAVLDWDDPLGSLARLVQEDVCIHQKHGAEHVLTGAILCFPAAWTLAEKLGRPLRSIHQPIARYDDSVAQRVQRMFDMVSVARPLWRANLLRYDLPDLYQPHTEAAPRPVGQPSSAYLRSERQSIRRLPRTDAVVFTIHTTLVLREFAPRVER